MCGTKINAQDIVIFVDNIHNMVYAREADEFSGLILRILSPFGQRKRQKEKDRKKKEGEHIHVSGNKT